MHSDLELQVYKSRPRACADAHGNWCRRSVLPRQESVFETDMSTFASLRHWWRVPVSRRLLRVYETRRSLRLPASDWWRMPVTLRPMRLCKRCPSLAHPPKLAIYRVVETRPLPRQGSVLTVRRIDQMVGHPGTAPGVSWSQTKRITFFLVTVKTGGLIPARTGNLEFRKLALYPVEL